MAEQIQEVDVQEPQMEEESQVEPSPAPISQPVEPAKTEVENDYVKKHYPY